MLTGVLLAEDEQRTVALTANSVIYRDLDRFVWRREVVRSQLGVLGSNLHWVVRVNVRVAIAPDCASTITVGE